MAACLLFPLLFSLLLMSVVGLGCYKGEGVRGTDFVVGSCSPSAKFCWRRVDPSSNITKAVCCEDEECKCKEQGCNEDMTDCCCTTDYCNHPLERKRPPLQCYTGSEGFFTIVNCPGDEKFCYARMKRPSKDVSAGCADQSVCKIEHCGNMADNSKLCCCDTNICIDPHSVPIKITEPTTTTTETPPPLNCWVGTGARNVVENYEKKLCGRKGGYPKDAHYCKLTGSRFRGVSEAACDCAYFERDCFCEERGEGEFTNSEGISVMCCKGDFCNVPPAIKKQLITKSPGGGPETELAKPKPPPEQPYQPPPEQPYQPPNKKQPDKFWVPGKAVQMGPMFSVIIVMHALCYCLGISAVR